MEGSSHERLEVDLLLFRSTVGPFEIRGRPRGGILDGEVDDAVLWVEGVVHSQVAKEALKCEDGLRCRRCWEEKKLG